VAQHYFELYAYMYVIVVYVGHRARVSFLEGRDGRPWTWVMGEHENDKTIEQILEEEAQEIARRQAELEAEQLRCMSQNTL